MKKSSILITILFIIIGLAAVSTNLIINGSTKISPNTSDFQVYYSNAKINGIQDTSVIKSDTTISFATEMQALGDTYTIDYDITNGSTIYDATLQINCTGANEYLEVNNTLDTDTNLKALQTRSGKLTITLSKSYTGSETSTTITCTLKANAVERTTQEKKQVSIVKQYGNGTAVGDTLCIGSECFYVVKNDTEKVYMLSKYNLYVGSYATVEGYSATAIYPYTSPTGIQDKNMYGIRLSWEEGQPNTWEGITEYGSTADYETSTIKTYVDSYSNYLSRTYGLDNEATLLSYDLIKDSGLVPDSQDFYNSYNQDYSFVLEGAYWMLPEEGSQFPLVISGAEMVFTSTSPQINSFYGVRPLIIIDANLLNN